MIGIDLEQFVRDPHGSGIQRVLQFLALKWPASVPAHFLMPDPDRDGVLVQLDAQAAAAIVSIPFTGLADDVDVRTRIHQAIRDSTATRMSSAAITDVYRQWLLPEVSYLPSVIERFESARGSMRTAMVGYDALPMTEPANYRFKPGSAAYVSEYFRMLAVADAVCCISEYSKGVILKRLCREATAHTVVAHPGGDHIDIREGDPPPRTRFCRVGTMEERKRPIEILDGFTAAMHAGLDAELVFVGRRSASKESINRQIDDAIAQGLPITWIQDASDATVMDVINHASLFLSIGIEGYGIPVLEALRLGTPVVYDGIQPAAEIMEGRGSRRLPASSPDEMSGMFMLADAQGGVIRSEIDPNAIPTWQSFTDRVIHSLIES